MLAATAIRTLIAGESWYEFPSWEQHPFRELPFVNNFIDNFSDPLDVDGDGRVE
jgi:hypothetical protein